MAQYGYGGGRANPFDQRNAAPQQGEYASQPYGQQSQYADRQYTSQTIGRDDYTGSNLELEPLTKTNDGFQNESQGGLSMVVLNECKRIDEVLDNVKKGQLATIKQLQQSSLHNPDSSETGKAFDKTSSEIMGIYRDLVVDVRLLKSQEKPGSQNSAQIKRVNKKLQDAIQDYRVMDVEFQRKLQEQMARQYRIVRPDASEEEIQKAVGNQGQQQVFSQALMQSNRRGQAQSAMSAVEDRHKEIQKIEAQMIDLAQLFEDLNALVVLQEAPVANIEMKGEEVVENMDKGNAQIGTAIKSARNARKWKWWCLGIVVLIIAIIVIVVLIYKFVIQNNNNSSKSTNKRFVLPSLERRAISAPTEERSEIPGLKWTRENTLAPVEERWVVDKLEWSPPSKKERRFKA
ncbi:Protein SSO2 [Lachnellula subtilissima]|uniref:Protein SSO2 n=1 Tax=Lachnellula subtilissima TaxID=602034 RepID=A0A8H8U7L4_9HELO|nr:Protein SSO2 [Lachnellula subtilissima]